MLFKSPRQTLLNLMESRFLVTGGVLGLAIVLTVLISGVIAGGSFRQTDLYISGAIIGLPLAVVLVAKWRWAFYSMVVLIVFEGMLRNLLNQASILLFKDVALGFAYVGCVLEYRYQIRIKPQFRWFTITLISLLVYSLIEFLNPQLGSPLIGIIGLKTFLFYIPVFYLAYIVLDSYDKIIRFVLAVLVLANISCAVGLFQFIGGPSIIQIFQPNEVFSSQGNLGRYYKLPGTFSAPGNYASFLSIGFVLAIGLIYSKTSYRLKVFSWLTLVNICVAFVLTSQRSSWVFVVACFFVGVFLQSSREITKGGVRVSLRFAVALFIILGFALAISSDSNIIGDRFSEFTNGNGLQRYVLDASLIPVGNELEQIAHGDFFGKGVGSTAPGARYLDEDRPFVESFIAEELYELGPLGFALIVILLGFILYFCWKSFADASDPLFRNLIFFIFVWELYMVGSSGTYAPLVVPPPAQFFWLLAGMVIRLSAMQVTQVSAAPEKAKPVLVGAGR